MRLRTPYMRATIVFPRFHFMNEAQPELSENLLVISIEGLASSLVGAYGSSIAATPAIDTLAAHGIVLDQCFVDSLTMRDMLISLWSARHALEDAREDATTLWQLLPQAGIHGCIITDCHQTAQLARRMGCAQIVLCEPPAIEQPASDVSDCWIMSLFSEAAATLGKLSEQLGEGTVLCWIHSCAFRLPWDAPLELRQAAKDADDPDPPTEIGPPDFEVEEDTDPDLITGWGQVAAAQVAVVDQAIGLFMQWIDELPEPWSWCLIGFPGVPLGQHGWVGWRPMQCFSEELHVVAIFTPQPPLPIGWRRSELCQLPDVGVTLATLCGIQWSDPVWGINQLSPPDDQLPAAWSPTQQLAVLQSTDQSWVRTPAWSLTIRGEIVQLYVKPDDRWDANDISQRCAEIVQKMQQHLIDFKHAIRQSGRELLPRLDESLCNLMR
ncbi:MAG: hypothetical protein KF752_13735 [Pirellulaceae bacterium]|nr:hypothetical protein [Pirellulaceae bacterium]